MKADFLRFCTFALIAVPFLAAQPDDDTKLRQVIVIGTHSVRSVVQAATGIAMTGSLGNPSTKVVMLVASDVNISGLAGLLGVRLRQSQSTGKNIVRASYIGQAMDQLSNHTALSLTAPTASAPVFIPGCSARNATFDCDLADFVPVAKRAIEPEFADRVN